MLKEQKINLIGTIILIGFCCAAYYHFVVMGVYLHKPYPFNTFLCCPNINFSDIHDEIFNTKDLHPYILEPEQRRTFSQYFPFAFIFLYPFSLISVKATFAIFIITLISAMLFGNYYFFREKNIQNFSERIDLYRNVFVFSFLTFPFLFEIDRANLESYMFIFEIIFLLFYLRGKLYYAAIFLSFSAAMKLYPGVLFFLFLKDKKYKEFIFGSVLTLVLSIVSLAMMKGSMAANIQGMLNEISIGKFYFAGVGGIPIDMYKPPEIGSVIFSAFLGKSSTLFGLIKIVMMALHFDDMSLLDPLFKYFCLLTLVVGVGLFFYLLKKEDSLWKTSMILICCTLLFNYTAVDYRIIHLFVPLWLFINSKEKLRYDLHYCILFALLLIPIQYQISINSVNIDFAAILNPLLMLFFIALIIKENSELKPTSLPQTHDHK